MLWYHYHHIILSSLSSSLSLLSFSADKGFLELVILLIEIGGCDVNRKDNNGYTALHKASSKGHCSIVSFLLQKGAYIECKTNVTNNRLTPLIEASRNNHIEIIKVLIENGANIDTKNSNGRTALLVASFFNNVEAVKYLIEYGGADINVKDKGNENFFHLAISRGHIETIKLIVENNYISIDSMYHSSILVLAVIQGDIDLINILINKGADINRLEDIYGSTILHLAINNNNHIEVVKLLIKSGADINCKDQDGKSPLMEACLLGHVECRCTTRESC
jgi:serine/threonine-protein phosphatase 6 regulatory ankyrin repeat subunit B